MPVVPLVLHAEAVFSFHRLLAGTPGTRSQWESVEELNWDNWLTILDRYVTYVYLCNQYKAIHISTCHGVVQVGEGLYSICGQSLWLPRRHRNIKWFKRSKFITEMLPTSKPRHPEMMWLSIALFSRSEALRPELLETSWDFRVFKKWPLRGFCSCMPLQTMLRNLLQFYTTLCHTHFSPIFGFLPVSSVSFAAVCPLPWSWNVTCQQSLNLRTSLSECMRQLTGSADRCRLTNHGEGWKQSSQTSGKHIVDHCRPSCNMLDHGPL